MADSVKITGNLADGTPINLSLDGATTQRQMERLIKLTADMAARITKNNSEAAKQEKLDKEQLKNTKEYNDQVSDSIDNQTKVNKETVKFEDALKDLKSASYSLHGGFKNLFISANTVSGAIAGMGIGLVQNLFDYSKDVGEGLKRGVAGGVMDFAISAKTAGVDMNTFTKALDESGGSFATLGSGATEGAKNFAALAGEVRHATASVGNLGMTNEELAMFTAQQTKVAVAQGYKGRQAQDLVIRNTKELGKEFDDLAARTGKNVMEMAQSAMKLAQDPLVASFIKSAGLAGKTISVEVQKLGASFRGLFGEAGDKMAGDLAKSAMSGLPFAITQSGKNMLMASSAVYSEMDRQAQLIKNGGKLEEADKEKLRNVVMQEVAARGDQLRTMAMLEGPAGDSARAILEMATEAEKYNDADRVEARKREQTAKDFNASVRDMQANLMALSIPFLKLINGVDWTFFIDILNGFVKVVDVLLTPFTLLGHILGDTGIGTVIGGLLALVTAGSVLFSGFGMLTSGIKTVTSIFDKLRLVLGTVIDGIKSTTGNSALTAEKTEKSKVGTEKSKIPDTFGLDKKLEERKLAEQAAEEQRKARTEKFYKQYREEGKSVIDAKRGADAAATLAPKATLSEKVAEKFAKASPMVEKFAGAITGATAALAGSALSIWGESRLREDANDSLGQFLVFTGKTMEIVGTFGGLFVQFLPQIKEFGAYMFSGKMTSALKDFGTSAMEVGREVWRGMMGLATTLWNGVIPPLVAFGKELWAQVIGKFPGIGKLMGSFGTWIMRGVTAIGALWTGLGGLSGVVASVTGFFAGLVEGAMALWAGLGGLSGIIASVTGFFVGLVEGAGVLLAGFGGLEGIIAAVGMGLETALAVIGGPITLVVAGLAALAAGIYYFWDDIKEMSGKLWDFITSPFKMLGDWLKDSWLGRLFGSGGSDSKNTNMASDKKQSRGNSGFNDMSQTPSVVNEDGTRRAATLTEINDAKASLRTGNGTANVSTAYPTDQSTTTSTAIPDTAAAANSQNAAKDTENQRQMTKQTNLLEELVASNSAQISIQSRTASLQDDSNKYLKTASLASV